MAAIPIRVLFAVLGMALFVACDNDAGGSPSAAALTSDATPAALTSGVTPEASPSRIPSATPVPTATPSPTPIPAPAVASAPVADLSDAPSALEILEGSFAAMEAVESMHLEMHAEVVISAGGTETSLPLELVGDYQAPDRFRSTLNVNLGFFSFDTETIAIGDEIYTTDPLTGEWKREEAGAASSFTLPAPGDFATGVDLGLVNPVLLDITESEDGVKVYLLSGAPPPDVFGSGGALSDAQFSVGVDDLLIRKIFAEAEVDVGELGPLAATGISGLATISLTITLSDFGVPVVIEAPELP